MAMPAAKGLFHRAATMSGQQVTAAGPFNATKRAKGFIDKLGIKDLAALRALPADQFLAGLKAVDPIAGSGGVYMGPVLDERSLTRHPFFPDAAPQSLDVPMMVGNTHDETRGFVGLRQEPAGPDLGAGGRQAAGPVQRPHRHRPGHGGGRLSPDLSELHAVGRLFRRRTAGRSWKAAIIQDEERAKAGAPAWAYQLDWRAPKDGGVWGAPHTLDMQLVFGNFDAPGVITGSGPDAVAMHERLADAFIAFARTGNPNNPSIPAWEPYTLPSARPWCSTTPPGWKTTRAAPSASCSTRSRSRSSGRDFDLPSPKGRGRGPGRASGRRVGVTPSPTYGPAGTRRTQNPLTLPSTLRPTLSPWGG
jgi:para-nitrobenzyl esterase